MKGRKPKPLKTQVAEGDPRKLGANKLKAKLASEPSATRGLPKCPSHVIGRSRKAWKFWATELADMELDHRPDAMMLEGACVNYARAVQADIMLREEGIVVVDSYVNDKGEVVPLKTKTHPAVSISNAAWRQVRAFCSEFGLSPVSRTRLAIEKSGDGEEDLLAILSRNRTKPTIPTAVH